MKITIYHGRTKPIVAVGEHQCRLLGFAFKYPGWHSFSKDQTTRRAVAGLEKRGCMQVLGDQFRFVFPLSCLLLIANGCATTRPATMSIELGEKPRITLTFCPAPPTRERH